ncbi:MAG: lipoyl synthase [Oligoflexia bacterium]|nr:lipoyl synthase [Oligoflexia bacterium]
MVSSTSEEYKSTKKILSDAKVCTVCEEARCPNIGECWHNQTATFMLLGDVCTRHCKFCAVKHGTPTTSSLGFEVEGNNLLEVIKQLRLKYVVLTSVTRDDYEDGGASVFAHAIASIKSLKKDNLKVEVLTPDFRAKEQSIMQFMREECMPDVFAHNIETVRSLTPVVRDAVRSSYDISIKLLKIFKRIANENALKCYTKSGLMLGLGESEQEVLQLFCDLREAEVDFLTIGQYLSPDKEKYYPVKEYISEEKFAYLKEKALNFSFKSVVAGPLVRSSYLAHKVLE